MECKSYSRRWLSTKKLPDLTPSRCWFSKLQTIRWIIWSIITSSKSPFYYRNKKVEDILHSIRCNSMLIFSFLMVFHQDLFLVHMINLLSMKSSSAGYDKITKMITRLQQSVCTFSQSYRQKKRLTDVHSGPL